MISRKICDEVLTYMNFVWFENFAKEYGLCIYLFGSTYRNFTEL